jgi:deoxyribose-phosphate aldolase
LDGSGVAIVSVAGFPLGACRSEVKLEEAALAVEDGAAEIDMVANLGWLCDDRFLEVEGEMARIRRVLPEQVILKVIIECNLLSERQQVSAARSVAEAGAQFVKTGTGFSGPVTVPQVQALRGAIGDSVGIKAAGGVRTAQFCRELIEAGANRIGSSACVDIIERSVD